MRLYSVLNGYIGESALSVLVIAASEHDAIEMAAARFAENKGKPSNYSDAASMIAYELCPDTSAQWVSRVSDGAHEG